uniref:E3 ubiquitin-protein ligase CHFR n=1 Tax=Oryzias sinensis TaxID=183150 RepID=A0A8C8DMA0_9TELE
MDSPKGGRPWGKLVKVDSSETVLLFSRECTVGRKKGCYLSFPANKLVSGEHCKIVKDQISGLAWIEDTSTNGTVINMSKLIKGQTHLLQNGDVIYFVYRKSEPQQSMESSAQSYSAVPESEMILSVEPLILTKTPRDLVQEEPKPSTSASHFCIENPSSCGTTVITTSSCSGKFSTNAAFKTDVPTCRGKKLSFLDKECASDLPFTTCPKVDGSADKDSSKSAVKETKTDKMEESLTCVICQDLLHDCISLQPCMHVFCAACYSGWMERSSLCPTCRCPVERICKNHFLNNLVEAYLTQHPEKCRSEEDLKSMDSRNRITQDMLQPKVERLFSDEEGSSDYLFESSDNDSDSSDTSQPLVMCRQCPGYRSYMSQPAGEEEAAKLTGEQPSTSSETASASQVYCCPPQGRHVLCTCCLQPMPDRRAELSSLPGFAQQCMLCQQPFCHMYWGCQRIGCQGCLSRFSELNLNDKCLDSVLNNNTYESEVLKNHLSSKGKTWKDLLQESLEGLQEGSFSLTDNVSGNTILCFCCGLRAFKELAYKYRQNIPASELPATVTSRPDCYWGRNCRTQVKAHHAT